MRVLISYAFLMLAALMVAQLHSAPDPVAQEQALPKIAPAPDFELTAQDGAPVKLSDYHGKVVAVTFIFTLCADTCPVLTPMMSFVQDQLGADFGKKVAFVSIAVDPEYRSQGIGTLLLRLVEERARQLVRNASPGTRVTLSGTVVSINNQAKRLFEREGYTPVRKYWRIAVRSNDSVEKTSQRHDVEVNLDIDSQCLVGASRLYDLDAIYIIREFDVFEKELRAGELLRMDANSELNMLVTLS